MDYAAILTEALRQTINEIESGKENSILDDKVTMKRIKRLLKKFKKDDRKTYNDLKKILNLLQMNVLFTAYVEI